MRPRLCLDVYVLTSSGLVPGRGHLDVARAAIDGGARMLQLRAPELPDAELRTTARAFAELCRGAGVVGVVNDRIDVALASGAAGVHLGQGDEPERGRAALGPDGILGVSVSTAEQARRAETFGADYLGVVVWTTASKPAARPVGTETLREIVGATRLPVVGIGGIDPTNAGEVIDAGAVGVAVVSAVGQAYDPVGATRSLVRVVASRRSLREAAEGVGHPRGPEPEP